MSFRSDCLGKFRRKQREKNFSNLKFNSANSNFAPSPPTPATSNYLTQVFSSFFLCPTFAVKPIAVHITTREKFVSAEKRYDVECKSSGSRPEAVLTWWKGSRQIKRMAKNVSIDLLAASDSP
jgi:CD80-like C2-set immunoglobulin domain